MGIIFVWGMILVCHLIYRRRVNQGTLPASDYRLPGAPFTTALALTFLALVVALLFFTEDGRSALAVGLVWAILVCAGYPCSPANTRKPPPDSSLPASPTNLVDEVAIPDPVWKLEPGQSLDDVDAPGFLVSLVGASR